MAIVPPPMMASDRGNAGRVTASTLVMNPASRSPGIAGMNARTPVARIIASPRRTSPSTATSVGMGILDRDSEPAGGAGFMEHVTGADERLGGIAASVETGAAHFPLLDHG